LIKFSTVVIFFLLIRFVNAETINYELYKLNEQGVPKLLTSGTRDYTPKEIEVQENKSVTQTENSHDAFYVTDGKNEFKVELGSTSLHSWEKGLVIKNGFVIGARIFRDKTLTGFGLWLKRQRKWYEIKGEDGCSWDWFNQEKGSVFSKLQGSGKVKATTTTGAGYKELTSVVFLEDVTLRLDDDKASFFSQSHTYNMIIKKGSVLRLAP
jgi:hypothetical protein